MNNAFLPTIGITVKVLGIDEGVNITVGLPVIRTSVDHGTAFDIAGTGKADERSLLAALNKKMGANCFTLLAGDETAELHIAFDSACTAAAAMSRLKTAPREALAAAHGTTL